MLVVLAILSTLFALGAGAFILSGRRLKAEAAADQLDLVIRQARNSALGGGTPAFVEFDTKARPVRVIPWAYRLVGMWHFEESGTRISGGFKNISFVHGGETVDGKIGKGLALASRGGKGFVECSADPDFDCEDGGYLEAYVFLEVAAPELGASPDELAAKIARAERGLLEDEEEAKRRLDEEQREERLRSLSCSDRPALEGRVGDRPAAQEHPQESPDQGKKEKIPAEVSARLQEQPDRQDRGDEAVRQQQRVPDDDR
jgi:hypothetical protein